MRRDSRTYLILVVDDEPANVELLDRRLRRAGYEVSTASSAQEALAEVARRPPNLMLLDICMPGMSGLEVLRTLRAAPDTHLLPIIMVTGLSATEDIVEAIQSGANDYVTKPINMPVLLARVETQLRVSGLLIQLEAQTKILGHLAAFDELTGVYNRRSLMGALEAQLSRLHQQHSALSLLMIDLDRFKDVNDTHGHAVGDAVLREFARRVAESARDADIVARYGGEEFCLILPESDVIVAEMVAERVRSAVADRPFRVADADIVVTASIGAASLEPGSTAAPAELLEQADRALYEAKRAGRNCVRAFGSDDVRVGGRR